MFQNLQHEFAEHIKDPDNSKAPVGIDDRRMAIYRDLFFNNIEGFVSSGFPVLRSLYCEHDWQRLVRCFFVEHQCHSPIFLDIAEEFVNFIASEYQLTPDDPHFMLELAHYEWVELAVSIKIETQTYEWCNVDDINTALLTLSEAIWPLQYQNPVHLISLDYQPLEAPETATCLVVYRNKELDVDFMLVTPAIIHLITLLQNNSSQYYHELVTAMHQAMPQYAKDVIEQATFDAISTLASKGIIRKSLKNA